MHEFFVSSNQEQQQRQQKNYALIIDKRVQLLLSVFYNQNSILKQFPSLILMAT